MAKLAQSMVSVQYNAGDDIIIEVCVCRSCVIYHEAAILNKQKDANPINTLPLQQHRD